MSVTPGTPVRLAVEALVAGWARTAVPGLRCVTEVPANLDTVLPLARFTRIGGEENWGLDRATIDVDYFDVSREAARAGALALEQKLRYDMRNMLLGQGVVSRVEVVVSAIATPWDDSKLRRFTSTLAVTMHSR